MDRALSHGQESSHIIKYPGYPQWIIKNNNIKYEAYDYYIA